MGVKVDCLVNVTEGVAVEPEQGAPPHPVAVSEDRGVQVVPSQAPVAVTDGVAGFAEPDGVEQPARTSRMKKITAQERVDRGKYVMPGL